MSLQHVQSGQPMRIPAGDWNRIVDATRAHFESLGQATPANSETRPPGIVPIRNDTGEPLKRFQVVGLEAPLFEPDPEDEQSEQSFIDHIAFKAAKPTSKHCGRIAVLLDPIDKESSVFDDQGEQVITRRFGRGLVSGLIQAKVKITDPAHQWCNPAHEEVGFFTSSHAGAAEVVYREPDENEDQEGLRWALIRLTPPEPWVRQLAHQYNSRIATHLAAHLGTPDDQRPDQTIPVSQLHFHDDEQSPIAWNDVQAVQYRNRYLRMGMDVPNVATEGYNQHGHTSDMDGGYIPGMNIHDHRDNFNGGYAFAVFHPGTALNQMPWAL